jgi:WD40 repeat protein
LSPDDKYLITGLGYDKIRVWDVKTGKLVREFC